jgi:hypothetical protein
MEPYKRPYRASVSVSCHSLSGRLSNASVSGVLATLPALLTGMSRWPNSDRARSVAASASDSKVTSRRRARVFRPVAAEPVDVRAGHDGKRGSRAECLVCIHHRVHSAPHQITGALTVLSETYLIPDRQPSGDPCRRRSIGTPDGCAPSEAALPVFTYFRSRLFQATVRGPGPRRGPSPEHMCEFFSDLELSAGLGFSMHDGYNAFVPFIVVCLDRLHAD